MKLQILRPEQEPIEGYKTVIVDKGNLNLSELSDNECDTILAPEVMDSFPIDSVGELINGIVSKLRKGGEVVIGGTDIRVFAKMVGNGSMDPQAASNVVANVASMTTVDLAKGLLTSLGLDIASSTIDGIHYEIKATRGR